MTRTDCVILFDQNEYGTYFTGQTVTGRVIITLNKPRKLRAIKLQICGYAECQWKDKHGKQTPHQKAKGRKKHCYYGREDYIASTRLLMGTEHGQNFTLDTGTYTFAFSCPIPVNCPSSYEGTYGHIRYLTKVTFIRAGAADRTNNVGFTVLKLFDLNHESALLKAPANNEALENICFFQSKPVHMSVNLMQTGYVPGQFILVSVHVNNESSIDCKKLLIILNLRASYTADTPCMRATSEQICLVKKICGPVTHNTQKHFAETIRVPATPPSCESLSKVVRVSYDICVIAVMNSFMRNPKTFIPITIGNVPLTDSVNPVPRLDDVPTTSTCAIELAGGSSHTLLRDDMIVEEAEEETDDDLNSDLPPPTYEEAMFMTTNIADDDVNTVSEVARFTPRYPVFDVDDITNAQGPPPNKPQKRRRRKRKQAPTVVVEEMEKPPVESPVQI